MQPENTLTTSTVRFLCFYTYCCDGITEFVIEIQESSVTDFLSLDVCTVIDLFTSVTSQPVLTCWSLGGATIVGGALFRGTFPVEVNHLFQAENNCCADNSQHSNIRAWCVRKRYCGYLVMPSDSVKFSIKTFQNWSSYLSESKVVGG